MVEGKKNARGRLWPRTFLLMMRKLHGLWETQRTSLLARFRWRRMRYLPATVSTPASTEGLPVLEPKKTRSLPTARMFFSTV